MPPKRARPSAPAIPEPNPPPVATGPFMGLTKLTSSQKRKWKNLETRKIQTTNFLKVDVLAQLGLDTLVGGLMTKTGLGNFLGKSAETYERYTLEFLSTLERREEDGVTKIRFRLDDVLREATYEELRETFGVDEPEGDWLVSDGFEGVFFSDLTGLPMNKKYLRASSFSHPAWKLFYRGLSMTFFGNGEPTQINQSIVSMMRTALPSSKVKPDWVDYFVRKCESLAESSSGNISVGGMISLIALDYVEAVSPDANKLGGPGLFTFEWLIKHDTFKVVSRPIHSLMFTYGDSRRFKCEVGAVYPSGSRASDWRMPGVENLVDQGEAQEDGDEFMRDAEEHQHQQGSLDQWTVMKEFLEEQDRLRREREQSRHVLEDRRWEEIQDRFEGLEDEAAVSRAQYRQLQLWAQQSEPRQYEPVSEDYLAMMQTRATTRAQRHSSRRTFYQGDSSGSHQ